MVERLVANEKVEGSNPLPAPVYERFIKKMCTRGKYSTIDTMKYKILKIDGWDVKSNDDMSFYLVKDLNLKILKKVKNLLTK